MLFRKKIERSCTYCRFATQLDDEQVLCAKKGVVSVFKPCRKFRPKSKSTNRFTLYSPYFLFANFSSRNPVKGFQQRSGRKFTSWC